MLVQGTGISALEFVGIREEYFISGIPLCKLKSKALSKWDNCQTICMTVKMERLQIRIFVRNAPNTEHYKCHLF